MGMGMGMGRTEGLPEPLCSDIALRGVYMKVQALARGDFQTDIECYEEAVRTFDVAASS